MSISFELRLDLFRVEREVYNFLDWLSDAGGLRDGLLGIGALVMLVHELIKGNGLEKWLVKEFFKKP